MLKFVIKYCLFLILIVSNSFGASFDVTCSIIARNKRINVLPKTSLSEYGNQSVVFDLPSFIDSNASGMISLAKGNLKRDPLGDITSSDGILTLSRFKNSSSLMLFSSVRFEEDENELRNIYYNNKKVRKVPNRIRLKYKKNNDLYRILECRVEKLD